MRGKRKLLFNYSWEEMFHKGGCFFNTVWSCSWSYTFSIKCTWETVLHHFKRLIWKLVSTKQLHWSVLVEYSLLRLSWKHRTLNLSACITLFTTHSVCDRNWNYFHVICPCLSSSCVCPTGVLHVVTLVKSDNRPQIDA